MDNGYKLDVEKLGKRIHDLRYDKNGKVIMTQDRLAELAGLGGKAQVSKYEKGLVPNISAETLLRFTDALGCEPDYLLGRIPHPKRTTSEISELIPLSREAIEALEYLGYELKEYEFRDAVLLLKIVNAVIIDLIYILKESPAKFVYPEGTYAVEPIQTDDGVKMNRRLIPTEESTLFEDLIDQSFAYKTIAEYDPEESDAITYREYGYAKLAIAATKSRIGNYLSNVIAEAVKDYANDQEW